MRWLIQLIHMKIQLISRNFKIERISLFNYLEIFIICEYITWKFTAHSNLVPHQSLQQLRTTEDSAMARPALSRSQYMLTDGFIRAFSSSAPRKLVPPFSAETAKAKVQVRYIHFYTSLALVGSLENQYISCGASHIILKLFREITIINSSRPRI